MRITLQRSAQYPGYFLDLVYRASCCSYIILYKSPETKTEQGQSALAIRAKHLLNHFCR